MVFKPGVSFREKQGISLLYKNLIPLLIISLIQEFLRQLAFAELILQIRLKKCSVF